MFFPIPLKYGRGKVVRIQTTGPVFFNADKIQQGSKAPKF